MLNLERLVKLSELYDQVFTGVERAMLREQLDTCIVHIRRHAGFSTSEDTASISIKKIGGIILSFV